MRRLQFDGIQMLEISKPSRVPDPLLNAFLHLLRRVILILGARMNQKRVKF